MIIVSWNCRGMGSTIKENAARDILINEKPDILMIQETKSGNQETENLKKKIRKYEGEAMQAMRHMHNMEKRNMGIDSKENRSALDNNEPRENQYKGEL